MLKNRLIKWVVLGIPIYIINFIIYIFVISITHSQTLAYWSWPIASPITLRLWDYIDNIDKNPVPVVADKDMDVGV